MKINRQELVNALKVVHPGLATQEMIEQTTSFAFTGGKIVTYNDAISISYPVKNLDITGAIKAEQLYKLLDKLTAEEIELEAKESEIIVSGKNAKAGIPFQAEITLPILKTEEITDWKELPENFLEALQFCLFSCSKDLSMPVFDCLHVTEEMVESSDNYRLSYTTLKTKVPVSPFLLPAPSAEKLIPYKATKIATEEGWVHFKTGDNCVFSARTHHGEFPATAGIIKGFKDKSVKKIPLSKELPAILDRAMVFTKQELGRDEAIKLEFENGKMKIRTEGANGWFEEKANIINYSGGKAMFSINPTYLKDICTKTDYLELTKDMVKFEGDNWVHIAALIVND